MNFYYAKVLDNNDTTFQGRVKVKIEHLMDSCSDDMCPWALPFYFSVGGMTLADSATPYGSIKTPRPNSLVWLFFADEKNFKHPFYMADVSLGTMNILHNAKVTAAIQAIINTTVAIPPPAMTVTYPNLHYTLYPNGLVIGISNDATNADCFVMNINAASYIGMNTSGSIYMKGTTVSILGTNGLVVPDPTTKGAFCALKNCLFTGAPHTGATIT